MCDDACLECKGPLETDCTACIPGKKLDPQTGTCVLDCGLKKYINLNTCLGKICAYTQTAMRLVLLVMAPLSSIVLPVRLLCSTHLLFITASRIVQKATSSMGLFALPVLLTARPAVVQNPQIVSRVWLTKCSLPHWERVLRLA